MTKRRRPASKQHRWRCLGHNRDGGRCAHRLRPGIYKKQGGRCRLHEEQKPRVVKAAVVVDPAFEETRARLDPGPPIDLLVETGYADLI